MQRTVELTGQPGVEGIEPPGPVSVSPRTPGAGSATISGASLDERASSRPTSIELCPPSTSRIWLVMRAARSDTRNATISPMSPGEPGRPNGNDGATAEKSCVPGSRDKEAAAHLGLGEARADNVHADAVLTLLVGEGAGKCLGSRLGHRVRADAGTSARRDRRRDEDESPRSRERMPAAARRQGTRRPGSVRHMPSRTRGRRVGDQITVSRAARAVHQDVNPAEHAEGCLSSLRARSRVTHVGP